MVLWNGACIVHETFSEKELIKLKVRNENAKIIAHPECPENILNYADFIGSTSALLKFTSDDDAQKFIVATVCLSCGVVNICLVRPTSINSPK